MISMVYAIIFFNYWSFQTFCFIIDHPPEFTERLYEGAIFENAQEGTSIAQIIAKDRDTGNFGKVYFTAIRGIHSSM